MWAREAHERGRARVAEGSPAPGVAPVDQQASIAEGSGGDPRRLWEPYGARGRPRVEALVALPTGSSGSGYPDGGLEDVPSDELVDRIARISRTNGPTSPLPFGPDGITGITGHPDHIVIGRAPTEAFRRFGGDGGAPSGFARACHQSREGPKYREAEKGVTYVGPC